MPPVKVPGYTNFIILVGFSTHENGRSCDDHPAGCGFHHVMNKPSLAVGEQLQAVWNENAEELPVHVMKQDGSLGCRVGFVARQYLANNQGKYLDGALIDIVDVYSTDVQKTPNPEKRRLSYRNKGYAHGRVVMKPCAMFMKRKRNGTDKENSNNIDA